MPRVKHTYVDFDVKDIRSYRRLESSLYLANGNWRATRRFQRYTSLRREKDGIALIYHKGEPLIFWTPDDFARLNADGIYTVSSRQRLNDWLPDDVAVYERSGYWWVKLPHFDDRPFFDGFVLDLETLSQFGPRFDIESCIAHNREWEKKISDYMSRWPTGLRNVGSVSGLYLGAAVENLELPLDLYSEAQRACGGLSFTYERSRQAAAIKWYLKRKLLRGAYTGKRLRPGVD